MMLIRSIGCVLFLLAGTSAFAQFSAPAASPSAEVRQTVGYTNFLLRYSRPDVRARVIFGELIPYGEIWRTGANEATLLSFDQTVRIGDQQVAAGTYSLFSVPDIGRWTIILNRDTTLWGTQGYDPALDVVRVTLEPTPLAERVETLEIHFTDLTPQRCHLTIAWENTRVDLPIELNTDTQVAQRAAAELGADATGMEYYAAARYYLDNNLDLRQAKQWMDRRMELDGEQFGVMRYQALIEYKLGEEETAIRTMERSLELARQAGNDHYVRMNEASLREWKSVRVTDLTGTELLDRAIDYHDPKGKWETGVFSLRLYESRPGSDYRLTKLRIDNGAGSFTLERQTGPEHVYRYTDADTCIVLVNGEEKMFVQAEAIEALRCRDNARYQDYYTYLWGLPMKLRDEGTIINPQVHRRNYFGRELLELKVTYDPFIGGDTWYFYFDPETYALRGYQFYHDEAANDGEYILLEDEVEIDGVRIPAKRYWYTHGDRRYLGSDLVTDTGTDSLPERE
jgi:hypothetical protein